VEQHWGVIPRRVRVVARPCGVRALNARTRRREEVRSGALERGGPHSRMRQSSSEADLARGGSSSPRARWTSPEGASSPRVRQTAPKGALRCVTWWAAGATAVAVALCACVGLEVSLCFVFFAGFKRDFPGCLRDPYGCPRQG
jgi:hypothetical protein